MKDKNSRSDQKSEGKPTRKEKSLIRRIVKLCCILLAVLILLIALAAGSVVMILSPSRLTPLVNKYSSQYLDASVRFDTVTLSLWEHFPHVSVKLSGGEIISHALQSEPDSVKTQIPAAADTLLRFEELVVALNLPRLLASQAMIRYVGLTAPEIYAFVAPSGKANWEIYSDTTSSDSSDATNPFEINFSRIEIHKQGHLVFDDRSQSLFAETNIDQLKIRKFLIDRYKTDIQLTASVRKDSIQMCEQLPIALSGGLSFNFKQADALALHRLDLKIDEIPIRFDGKIAFASDTLKTEGLRCDIEPLALNRLVALAPQSLFPRIKHIDTDLELTLKTRIMGSFHAAGQLFPHIEAEVSTNGGHFAYAGSPTRIDRFKIDALLRYNPDTADSTGIRLNDFDIEGSGIQLAGQATIWDLLGDPSVTTRLSGGVNLDTLSRLYPSERMFVSGNLKIDAIAKFRKNDLCLERFGNVRIGGLLSTDSLLVDAPSDSIFVLAHNGTVQFGSGFRRFDSIEQFDEEMLRIRIDADSLDLRMKDQSRIAVSKASTTLQSAVASLSGDTTAVHPIKGNISAHLFDAMLSDSSRMRLGQVNSSFGIKPSADDPKIPELDLTFDAGDLWANDRMNWCDFTDSRVDFHATLVRNKIDTTRQRILLDSLQKVYPSIARDSLLFHHFARLRATHQPDDFAAADLNMSLDKNIADKFRRWNASGSIRAASGRIATPYFPLSNRIENANIEFTTNEVKLEKTVLKAGESSLELNGKISNLKQVLLRNGKLKIQMSIESDTLNFNELIHAASVGSQYTNSSESYKQMVAEADNTEELQQVIEEQSGITDSTYENALLIVPSNIDAEIDLHSRYGIYGTLHLNSLKGAFIARDRCLQINNLNAVTDAGDMALTALYATRSKKDIITGFDLELRKVKVDRLISLIPSVDSLLPMLRSFEGVVDCQLAATASVDTMMNIELPSLNAACSIHGENMVLLDGETFTEIAKMLRFKNRDRNLINSISVNFLVHDNQIEIFPFIIEMDRYKAAVSGIHKLDMSFDYHISVLKSPIPFRLGLNISGTLDKFKFRIGKAKYKDENIPSYVTLIDTTRINLRHTITDIFHKGIDAARLERMEKAIPVVDTAAVQTQMEPLSKADSLELQREGIIEQDSIPVIDSLPEVRPVPVLPTDTLSNGSVPPLPSESTALPESDESTLPGKETEQQEKVSRKAVREEKKARRKELREARRQGRTTTTAQ